MRSSRPGWLEHRLRAELLDRTLIWNETHLRHALREYEQHCNLHRTHRSLAAAARMRARPQALGPERIERLVIRRHDRLGGVFHEYRQVA
ncbi:integrase [Amycolatopsis sp. AA4]|nr:integrase [Amycolatopsis sp. AA4]